MTDTPPVVQLVTWQCRVYGDRWTLEHEDRAVLTFATELEARRAAKRYGWRVETGEAWGVRDADRT